MTRRFSKAPGVLLAPLGDRWAAFSPLSGTSHLLNDESAAIVMALDADTPASTDTVCRSLAASWDEPADALAALVEPVWDSLVAAGLVIEHGSGTER